MKKSFGFGKKNLYLGFAFLIVVGLLSFFVFSTGREEGFTQLDPTKFSSLNTSSSIGQVSATIISAQNESGKCVGDYENSVGVDSKRIKCSSLSKSSCRKPCTWRSS